MLIWIVIFAIVLGISFILALRSMGDYQELPQQTKTPYSVFLVRQPQALTAELLKQLHKGIIKEHLILSLERLYKDQREALVVFGPVKVLQRFSNVLGLLELEDYSQKIEAGQSWEVGTKNGLKQGSGAKFEMPEFLSNEQFWWQIVLDAQNTQETNFKAVIRAVLQTEDHKRAVELEQKLSKIGTEIGLVVLPKEYTSAQIINFYQQRSVPQTASLIVTADQALSISSSSSPSYPASSSASS